MKKLLETVIIPTLSINGKEKLNESIILEIEFFPRTEKELELINELYAKILKAQKENK